MIDHVDQNQVSKFLSFILRHKPEAIGLSLDSNGWASVCELITKSKKQMPLSQSLIEQVVASNNKNRFTLSADKKLIRANQGHSINVNLELAPKKPPQTLYHGTTIRFLESIASEGLRSGKRQYVHLSDDIETAKSVGNRHGIPVVLTIASGQMHERGFVFYLSNNNVWLADRIPAEFITYK